MIQRIIIAVLLTLTITAGGNAQRPARYPTPGISVARYLRPAASGRSVTVRGPNLAQRIQAAQDDPRIAKVIISGGGAITQQVTLKKYTVFADGEYSCQTRELLDGGVFLIASGVRVEFGRNAVIIPPDYTVAGTPASIVFQGLDSLYGSVRDIALSNVRIRGKELYPDYKGAGVRQAVSLGNCINCVVDGLNITGANSIGVQFGGSAAKGNHAEHGLVINSRFDRFAAAAVAIVNARDMIVANNTFTRPGHGGNAPGGVSAIDVETNTAQDWCADLKIFNNQIDFTGAVKFGSAILAQNALHVGTCTGLLIANNDIRYTPERLGGGLTSGIFFTGRFPRGVVAGNRIERSQGAGIQLYGAEDTLFQDNDLISVGGGGLPAIYMLKSYRNTFRRTTIRVDPSIPGSVSEEVRQDQSTGNVFERP